MEKQRFVPLPGFMAVRKMENRKVGSIIVPETSQNAELYVQVIAVPEGVTDVKPDDILLLPSNTKGVPFTLNGESVLIIQREMGLGVMHDPTFVAAVDESKLVEVRH